MSQLSGRGSVQPRSLDRQLVELGLSAVMIDRRLEHRTIGDRRRRGVRGRPVLEHDEWGRWMGATLTPRPASRAQPYQRRRCSADSGPCRAHSRHATRPRAAAVPGVMAAYSRIRSSVLGASVHDPERESRDRPDVPRSGPRHSPAAVSDRALARSVREAIRQELTTVEALADAVGRHRFRRGTRRLATTLARYAGLPWNEHGAGPRSRRSRSFAPAGCPLPLLNVLDRRRGGRPELARATPDRRDRRWAVSSRRRAEDASKAGGFGVQRAGLSGAFPPRTSTSARTASSTSRPYRNVRGLPAVSEGAPGRSVAL